MKKQSLWILMVVIMTILAACGKSEAYEPHAINEATDRCAICNMAIKDDEFATQIITKDGQSLKFDDLGCMNEWKVKNGVDQIGAEYVRDYSSKEWLKYDKAFYAYDASYRTPMAYGVVSFESEQAAQAFIDEHGAGVLMTATDLAKHEWATSHSGSGGHGHGHDEVDSQDDHDDHDGDKHGDQQDDQQSKHGGAH